MSYTNPLLSGYNQKNKPLFFPEAQSTFQCAVFMFMGSTANHCFFDNALGQWAGYTPSQSLGFLIFKVEIVIEPPLQDHS